MWHIWHRRKHPCQKSKIWGEFVRNFGQKKLVKVNNFDSLLTNILSNDLELKGNQKALYFQLHHRLSKFEVPVFVNLKHIFEIFRLYITCFLIQKQLELIRLSSDGQFWKKSQNKKGGRFELRSYLCYYNCNRLFYISSSLAEFLSIFF